jgi:hypothetical protein
MKIKLERSKRIDEIVPPDGVTVPTTSTTASQDFRPHPYR